MTAIEPAPCHHKHADHQHGTRAAYVLDKCRCDPCRAANTRATRERRRAQLYGRWDGLTDAQPARDHIHTLTTQGMGLKQVAAAARISSGTLTKLIYGAPRPDGTRRPPARRVRPDTAARLLAVTPHLADGARIDATGTRRRLQALAALGWSVARLAATANVDRQVLGNAATGRRALTTAGTARAVTRLYEQLWDTPPPATTGYEQASITSTRNRAARNGWAPPAAWDDDTIDDPDAHPDTGEQEPSPGRKRLHLDDVDWLLDTGESPALIPGRVGVTPSGIAKAYHRAGRPDRAALFNTVTWDARRRAS